MRVKRNFARRSAARNPKLYRAFASESTRKFPPPKTSGSVKARIVAEKRANMIFIYWLLKMGRP